VLARARRRPPPARHFPVSPRTILLTAHRRESFGEPLREALTAVRTFVNLTPDVMVYYPLHPNPAARSVAHEVFANQERVMLAEPASYGEIVGAMQNAWLIVTDSGGLQEEAPALGKPVLVLRDVTERPEAVEAGAVRVVGTTRSRVFQALIDLYCDSHAYERMARPVFPYGDGRAAQRIVAAIYQRFAAPAANAARAIA
jgi:UDP-N-acetylglucosamine 2-epimerase (non-hydrolysing)